MKKRLNILLWDFLGFLLEAATLAFSSRACRRFFQKALSESYDVIIVPGVPYKNGKWDPIMKARVYWARHVIQCGAAKHVIFSGNAVYSPYYEAKVMALYARAIGIPDEKIRVELLAEHSTENVYYSYKLAQKLGYRRIALATDPFQAKMLRKFVLRKVSPDIGFLPVVFGVLRKMRTEMAIDPEIDPSPAFVPDFVSIRERMNFQRRFKGTKGYDIDHDVYR